MVYSHGFCCWFAPAILLVTVTGLTEKTPALREITGDWENNG